MNTSLAAASRADDEREKAELIALVRMLTPKEADRVIERIQALLNEQFQNSYHDVDPASLTGSARGDYLVLLGARMREQTYLDWLNECRTFTEIWHGKP